MSWLHLSQMCGWWLWLRWQNRVLHRMANALWLWWKTGRYFSRSWSRIKTGIPCGHGVSDRERHGSRRRTRHLRSHVRRHKIRIRRGHGRSHWSDQGGGHGKRHCTIHDRRRHERDHHFRHGISGIESNARYKPAICEGQAAVGKCVIREHPDMMQDVLRCPTGDGGWWDNETCLRLRFGRRWWWWSLAGVIWFVKPDAL